MRAILRLHPRSRRQRIVKLLHRVLPGAHEIFQVCLWLADGGMLFMSVLRTYFFRGMYKSVIVPSKRPLGSLGHHEFPTLVAPGLRGSRWRSTARRRR